MSTRVRTDFDPAKAEVLSMPQRKALCDHLIDVLADLHAVDVDEVGLGDLARRDGYIERQLKRWTTQWANSKTREHGRRASRRFDHDVDAVTAG